MRRRALVAAALAAALAVGPAWAQVTETDLLVAGRAIGFIDNLRPGNVAVGIVYEPGNAQSEQQAKELAAMLGDGLRIGSFVLKPSLLPIGKIGNAKSNLFFLTAGIGADADKVARASRTAKIPCLTFDLDQVRNGHCTMGVRSRPKIEVLVNRSAAEASGTDFAAAFRMMITEL